MKKNTSIIILGLLIALVTFLDGIPERWETLFTISAGLLIALLAYILRRDAYYEHTGGVADTFVQNRTAATSTTDGIDLLHGQHTPPPTTHDE